MKLVQLRAHAVSQSLFRPTGLKAAIERLGFVQADPIRAPARAQDLILRQRVVDYRAGDLERHYPSLDIEEDMLYAYGFLPRAIWRWLHPRNTSGLGKLEKRVLETVREGGELHPRELDAQFGRAREINAWGGYSRSSKRALEALHYRGLLRVARRENGVRVYAAMPPLNELITPAERIRNLLMVITNLLAPALTRTLQSILAILRRRVPGSGRAHVLDELVKSGELTEAKIDGLSYLLPTGRLPDEAPRRVRFLAPFDPLVWDRRRFEHLWGWPYRFEAYTPSAKRLRGYYAMPLLWGDAVIGWANAAVADGRLEVALGFAGKRPRDPQFRAELERETSKLETFLSLK